MVIFLQCIKSSQLKVSSFSALIWISKKKIKRKMKFKLPDNFIIIILFYIRRSLSQQILDGRFVKVIYRLVFYLKITMYSTYQIYLLGWFLDSKHFHHSCTICSDLCLCVRKVRTFLLF